MRYDDNFGNKEVKMGVSVFFASFVLPALQKHVIKDINMFDSAYKLSFLYLQYNGDMLHFLIILSGMTDIFVSQTLYKEQSQN